MERSPSPFLPHTLLILRSHRLNRRQERLTRQDGRDCDSLELEEREVGYEERDTDKDEGRIGNVEDIFLQIMD